MGKLRLLPRIEFYLEYDGNREAIISPVMLARLLGWQGLDEDCAISFLLRARDDETVLNRLMEVDDGLLYREGLGYFQSWRDAQRQKGGRG